jgi:hypothetical protein
MEATNARRMRSRHTTRFSQGAALASGRMRGTENWQVLPSCHDASVMRAGKA